MLDFLAFRRMMTPVLIQFLFWLSVIVLVVGGVISAIYGGMNIDNENGVAALVSGIAAIIIGPFISRIYCEFLMLFFRMNETLTDIMHNTERK